MSRWGLEKVKRSSLDRVNTIVFDKTDTLTIGKPAVTDFMPVLDDDRRNELSILQLAASLEDRSEHPFAMAIVNYAKDRQLQLKPVEKFQAIVRSGVQGIVAGKLIQIGSIEWIDKLNISTAIQLANRQIFTEYQQQWESEGKTVAWLAIDCEIAGIISVIDPIEPTAVEMVSRLKQLGLEVVLLTGDNLANAERLVQTIGIDRVFAQIKPQGKVEVIRTLQSTNIGRLLRWWALGSMTQPRSLDRMSGLVNSE
jgi:P-type Cu+ transporter